MKYVLFSFYTKKYDMALISIQWDFSPHLIGVCFEKVLKAIKTLLAQLEGVSLNQYIVSALSRAAGRNETLYAREKKAKYNKTPG